MAFRTDSNECVCGGRGGGRGGGSTEAGVMTYLYYNGVNDIWDSMKVAFLCSQFDCMFGNTKKKIKRLLFFFKFGAHP